MKKSILSVMAVAGLFFASQTMRAQQEPVEETTEEIEAEVAPEVVGFEMIDVLALPQPVKDATMTEFNAVASEAWVKLENDKKIYKLNIASDGEVKTVYATVDGEWLKEDEVIDGN
jgi:hypothetical protein